MYFVSVPVCDELHPCEGLGRYATFKNFGMAFLLLFRVSTGDNWNGIMKVGHSQFIVLDFSDAHSFVLNASHLFWVRLLATYSALIFTLLCVHIAGHAQRLLPGDWRLLQHSGVPLIFCVLRPDGAVCAGQCGDCCAHEAPGGKQQGGQGGG